MKKGSKKTRARGSSFPLAKLIGIRALRASRGGAVATMTAARKHLNPMGTVHGGILCDLADAAMGYAFISQIPEKQMGLATSFHINFMRAARVGDRLRATAKTTSHGKSIYFMECVIKNATGKIVATASSCCKILQET
ncbi:MAG: PaaI family thioesterase [Candidatus Omnitrophota bacterium]|nr:PaaI family thioesterase [Candidatus Omnitrophota bacterium]